MVRHQSRPGDWAITCFYVRPDRRGQGLASVLLDAAIAAAKAAGARHLEAYPIAATNNQPAADMFPGTLNLFLRAGFTEVGRRRGRPTVRRSLSDGGQR
ncbi:GNAT family N-acetyltransferase [Micromonospora sp. NPDC023966]|uniref:GNAT family N-acetyltransferase n=1 Tax=Micromonospora sp. NPDC023966 TaxID=3154699 RepID=UPI0033DC417C